MKRKLFIHIGVHRTASTSIQQLLHTHSTRLLKQGILYPFGVRRHYDVANGLLSGTRSPGAVARQLSTAADRVRGTVHSIIVSDEDICMRKSLAPLAALADRFDVRIVSFLRRQDLWLESWYQQNVKWQWNPKLAHLPFAEFLARRHQFHWIDYDTSLRRMEALFGAGNVLCRVFEKSAMPDGPVAAFCEATGIDIEGFPDLPRVNSSLSPLMTEFIRQLPLHEIEPERRRTYEKACARADWHLRRAIPDQGSLLMDLPSRQEILAEHGAHNEALARRVFGRDTLFRDPLPNADAPLAPQALPSDPAELIRLYVAPMVRALAQLEQENAKTLR